ncbi:MAG: hypothetical protein C5B50_12535 [Verrucomicrobia bacterium]|nr:MAG: hypothetical protein C5B50_12535 [Verrucomicrobiota bacterium]
MRTRPSATPFRGFRGYDSKAALGSKIEERAAVYSNGNDSAEHSRNIQVVICAVGVADALVR